MEAISLQGYVEQVSNNDRVPGSMWSLKGVLLACLFVFEPLKTNCDALTVLDV